MIQVKQLFDAVEKDDGLRIWVEPVKLTLDLIEWCKVDQLVTQWGPTMELSRWFETHPTGYEYFRAKYHDLLGKGTHRKAMLHLVALSRNQTVTLLHQGDDPVQNAATALHEYLAELDAYVPPEK
jgi:uncharacterized protein YeaO (DUF488 family)